MPRRLGPSAPSSRGFTLLETALTTVIIGVGVLAMIDAQRTFMVNNDWSTQSATATYLANEVRELTRNLSRHDPVTGLYFQANGAASVLRGWGQETGETTIQDLNDLDDFDGLTFGFNGTPGLADGDLPGPVDGFGDVIPDVGPDGAVRLRQDGTPLPLQGWSQRVRVEKLDPFNTAMVRGHEYTVGARPPDFDGINVDQFPLRVVVEVFYQGPLDTQARSMATVAWIVPAANGK